MFESKTKIRLPPNMNKSPLVKIYEKPEYKYYFKPKSGIQSIRNQYHRLSSKNPKTNDEKLLTRENLEESQANLEQDNDSQKIVDKKHITKPTKEPIQTDSNQTLKNTRVVPAAGAERGGKNKTRKIKKKGIKK